MDKMFFLPLSKPRLVYILLTLVLQCHATTNHQKQLSTKQSHPAPAHNLMNTNIINKRTVLKNSQKSSSTSDADNDDSKTFDNTFPKHTAVKGLTKQHSRHGESHYSHFNDGLTGVLSDGEPGITDYDIPAPILDNSPYSHGINSEEWSTDSINGPGLPTNGKYRLKNSFSNSFKDGSYDEINPQNSPQSFPEFIPNHNGIVYPNKRYIDDLGSSLVKKSLGAFSKPVPIPNSDYLSSEMKQYPDYSSKFQTTTASIPGESPSKDWSNGGDLFGGFANSERNNKRYIDDLGSSLVKKKSYSDKWSLGEVGDEDTKELDKLGNVLGAQNEFGHLEQSGYDSQRENLGFHGQSLKDKRYMDDLGSSFIKRKSKSDKRYLDDLGSSFVKKNSKTDKRYLDDLGSSFVKKNTNKDKRYLDDLGSSFVKKNSKTDKRYLDDLGSSFVKKNTNTDKRYLDDLGSSFVKKNTNTDKRYLDDLGSSFVKKNTNTDKRYLDDLGSSFVKKNIITDKRYLDDLGSSFVKKNTNTDKRYLDDLGMSFIKKNSKTDKRYLDDLGSSFVKKNTDKRYMDDLGSSFVKKSSKMDKRYLDDLGTSLVKKSTYTDKRYLDDLGSSLVKKNTNKRYLDDLGSSFVKKSIITDKRYLDDLGSSFVKKNSNTDKRYLDDLGSSFVKKNTNTDKRYLDDLGTSLVKKSTNTDKRYLDDLGSSFVKKNTNTDKRYLDDLGSSFVKKNTNTDKRYLDDLGTSLVKKSTNTDKRYLDDLGSSFVKKSANKDKRYLDDLGSSFVKKNSNADKRYLDDLGTSLVKKSTNTEKRYLDDLGSSFVKKSTNTDKRYLDDLGMSFVKKNINTDKRYLDDLGSSFVKKSKMTDKRYLDDLGSSFVKKSSKANKRYLDDLGSSFVKKNSKIDKRYLDDLGTSLVKKNKLRVYLNELTNSLLKRTLNIHGYQSGIPGDQFSDIRPQLAPGKGVKSSPQATESQSSQGTPKSMSSNRDKRMMEVTDDVMDGSQDWRIESKGDPKSRKRRQALDFRQTPSDFLGNRPGNGPLTVDIDFKTARHPYYGLHHFPYSSNLLYNRLRNGTMPFGFEKNENLNDDTSHGRIKRYLDDVGSNLIKRSSDTTSDDIHSQKRYLDDISSSIIRKRDTREEEKYKFLNSLLTFLMGEYDKVKKYDDTDDDIDDDDDGDDDVGDINDFIEKELKYPSSDLLKMEAKRFTTMAVAKPSSFGDLKPGKISFQRFTPRSKSARSHNDRRGNRWVVYEDTPNTKSGVWSNRHWSNRITDLPGKKTLRSIISPTETAHPTLMSAMLLPTKSSRPQYRNTKSYIRSAMQKFIRLQGKSRTRHVNYNTNGNPRNDVSGEHGGSDLNFQNNFSLGLNALRNNKLNTNNNNNHNNNYNNNHKYKNKNRHSIDNNIEHEFSGQYDINGYSTYQEQTNLEPEPTHDYFDSLAGSLLQT